jgi:hypothetical protein
MRRGSWRGALSPVVAFAVAALFGLAGLAGAPAPQGRPPEHPAAAMPLAGQLPASGARGDGWFAVGRMGALAPLPAGPTPALAAGRFGVTLRPLPRAVLVVAGRSVAGRYTSSHRSRAPPRMPW